MSSGELRRRAASKISRDTSESELSDGGYTETDEKPPEKENPKEHSKGDKKLAKIVKRLVFGTLLLFMLCGIIAAGHLWTLFFVRTAGFELARPCPRTVRVLLMAPNLSVPPLQVVLIQVAMFRELVNVRYSLRRFKEIPLFRTSQWGWFYACLIFSYGQSFKGPGRAQLIQSQLILSLLPYLDVVSLMLYSLLLVGTVLTLRSGLYKYQMGQLAWTISIVVITVVQVHSFSANVLAGLFWFLFPVSLVICNDSMAYFCGMGFGRKFIKRPFLGALSPNKTWEGFIGGGICTVVFAFITPPFYPTALICPCEELKLLGGWVFRHSCEMPSTFTPHVYVLPGWLTGSLLPASVTLLPIQLHALVLGLFASLVAPFGGFFASGIKRAYNLDDFASIIPGHGGVYDRVDCQLIMGLATQTYYATFIQGSLLSAKIVVQLALALPEEERLVVFESLGAALKKQGYVLPAIR